MTKKRLISLSLIVGLLLIIVLYVFAFPMKQIRGQNQDLRPFNREDFIDAQKVVKDNGKTIYEDVLNERNKKVAENDRFTLTLDEVTSYFKVEDKVTGEIYESNPNTQGDQLTNKQRSTMEIAYQVVEKGKKEAKSQKTIDNYANSIHHPRGADYNKSGRRTFALNYNIDDGFQILYRIESLEITYLWFPMYLDEFTYQAVVDFYMENDPYSFGFITFRDYYTVDTTQEGRRLIIKSKYESLKLLEISDLYEIFYPEDEEMRVPELGVYSPERVEEENVANGAVTNFEHFFFEVGVEVKLTKTGIETTILKNSIKESSEAKIEEIILYPMFGSVGKNVDGELQKGEIIIPDGSGAVIELNNGKGIQRYKRRIYGNDLAMMPYKESTSETIIFPFYGLTHNNSGFSAIVSEGDAMASINAMTSTDEDGLASVTGPYNHKRNLVYTSFRLREKEEIRFGAGIPITLVTKDIVETDFQVSYYFLDDKNSNYVGIAKAYRQYLEDYSGLVKKDFTTNPVLTLELIGSYTEKGFILGVPYNRQKSMTTFKQAKEIISILKEEDINDLNILYQGAINGGLDQKMATKAKIEKSIGGKKGFKKFEKEMNELGIDVFVNLDLITVDKYNRPYDRYRYSSKRIAGETAVVFDYKLGSGLYDRREENRFALSPAYYQTMLKKFNKSYHFNNLNFENMGSTLAGDYSSSRTIYKQETLEMNKKLFSEMDQNIMISKPLGYVIPYLNYITDLSSETTMYSIVDYSIPLVQLVLSGYIDYSTRSLNLSNERDIRYEYLKAIETGSNLKFSLSYESSRNLLNTPYNKYYSTEYTNWMDIIIEYYNEIKELNIHNAELIGHEYLGNNVYKSIYSNGLNVTLNYNAFSVVVNGKTIDGLSYVSELI